MGRVRGGQGAGERSGEGRGWGGSHCLLTRMSFCFRREDDGFLSPRLSGFGLFGRTKRTEVLFTEGL